MKRLVCMIFWFIALPVFAQDFEDAVDPVEDIDGGPATVFVSPFQHRNAAAAGLAGMMSSFTKSFKPSAIG